MKTKALVRLLIASMILFVSDTGAARPIDLFVTNGLTFAKSMGKLEVVVAQAIHDLDKVVTRYGNGRVLSFTAQGKLASELAALEMLVWKLSYDLSTLKDSFRELTPHSPQADKAGSISVVFGSTKRQLDSALHLINKRASVGEILSHLRELYFAINNISGNALISIYDAQKLSKVSGGKLIKIKDTYKGLLDVFLTSSKRVLNTPPTAAGDRTISYVIGSTFGTISNRGPSNLAADVASSEEAKLVRDLYKNILLSAKYFNIKVKKLNPIACETEVTGD